MKRNIMITGAAGFIGSHVTKYFVNKYPNYNILVVDNLTYAGNLNNLKKLKQKENFFFSKTDICDYDNILAFMRNWKIDGVIHLAAESHVDNSIKDPFVFARTNVMGTLTLLHAAMTYWKNECPDGFKNKMFYHVSTDEVYGALDKDGTPFTENNRYEPHSPYSASKASSDHFVRAYHDTYGLPVVISNCSNNYGPNQFPEKLIPLVVIKIVKGEKIPVYGTGENIRDWLYVGDHVRDIDMIFHRGTPGETYNIGGSNEITNIDIVKTLIKVTDRILGNEEGYSENLITYVTDRPGHDFRYAIDSTKLQTELGWKPEMDFEKGIEITVLDILDDENN